MNFMIDADDASVPANPSCRTSDVARSSQKIRDGKRNRGGQVGIDTRCVMTRWRHRQRVNFCKSFAARAHEISVVTAPIKCIRMIFRAEIHRCQSPEETGYWNSVIIERSSTLFVLVRFSRLRNGFGLSPHSRPWERRSGFMGTLSDGAIISCAI